MGDDVDKKWKPVKSRRRIENKEIQKRFDIATVKGQNSLDSDNLTTFFFTDFPNSFGAKAMLNAFHYYGDIQEVVIPAKRDKGGRRFGFARFYQVSDARRFARELDNLIIGRDKISVNISRYNRFEGTRRQDDQRENRKEKGVHQSNEGRLGEGQSHRSIPQYGQQSAPNNKEEKRSYAQVVRRDKQEKRCILSYEAAKEDMERLQKAYIGVVAQAGMSYNIQSAFHSQGYFGVKVTPLGANLTLLEGQDDGEVKALMEEAKGWLDQWFVEIKPWSPNDIDVERTIWLRVYGVPVHAWNDSFFAQFVKPWGTYINADDGTTKKFTMDVARLMIRTSCQIVVDEFVDVKINGEIFHIRVLEDSYGPMQIMIPPSKGPEIRDSEGDSEDEEEHDRGLFMEEEEEEQVGESEREDDDRQVDNLLALTSVVNTNNVISNIAGTVLESNKSKEVGMAVTNYFNSNSNESTGVACSMKGGSNKVDNKLVEAEFSVGQEEGRDGTQNSPNTNLSITGGAAGNSNSLYSSNEEGERLKGGVYSDGPRIVYNKLNKLGPSVPSTLSCPNFHSSVPDSIQKKRIHPLPAKVRRQNQIIQNCHLRRPNNPLPLATNHVSNDGDEATSRRTVSEVVGAKRNSPTRHRARAKPVNSLSSAGEVLCCSSIDSLAIRNCNSRFLLNHDTAMAKKVWEGACELGVEGEEEDGRYVERILINEQTEESARRLRVQHNQGLP
jgi:hypothetical protein